MRTAERGFTMLEAVVCAGLFAIASAASAGAFAAVARNTAEPALRDAALSIAENTLVRARAAVAYASSPDNPAALLPPEPTWGLRPGASAFVAGVELRAPAPCAGIAPLRVALPVTTTFDPSTNRFSVSVTYPRDPCAVAADGTISETGGARVTLVETLPPSVYPPGQEFLRDVMTPARM